MSNPENYKKPDAYSLTPKEREERRQVALAYAAEHLKAGVQELVEWSNAGVLGDGHVRRLAQLFVDAGADGNGLAVAKAELQNLAMLKMLELMK